MCKIAGELRIAVNVEVVFGKVSSNLVWVNCDESNEREAPVLYQFSHGVGLSGTLVPNKAENHMSIPSESRISSTNDSVGRGRPTIAPAVNTNQGSVGVVQICPLVSVMTAP